MSGSVSLYAGGSFGPGFNIYGLQGPAVASVPESIRTVPIHPDDTYASPADNGPIPSKDNRSEPLFNLLSLELGLKVRDLIKVGDQAEDKEEDKDFTTAEKGISLRLGLGADFGIVAGLHLNERNYTNAPGTDTRGYGAALTYYNVGPTPVAAQLVIVPKVFGELSWKYIMVRQQLLAYEKGINTGWDRNDGLQRKSSYTLGTALESQTLVGFRWGGDLTGVSHLEFRLTGGVAVSKLFPNSLGKECGARTGEVAPIFGFAIDYTYDIFSR